MYNLIMGRGSQYSDLTNEADHILYGQTGQRKKRKLSTSPIAVLPVRDPDSCWHQLNIETLNSDNTSMNEGWFENSEGWSGVDRSWYIKQESLPYELTAASGEYFIAGQGKWDTLDLEIYEAMAQHRYEHFSKQLEATIKDIDKSNNLLILDPELVSRPLPGYRYVLHAEYLLVVETLSNIPDAYWLVRGNKCFYQHADDRLLGYVPFNEIQD